MADAALAAEFELGYTYTRTPGPIIGRFFAALMQRRLFGMRAADGKVLFPPTEYDPRDASELDDWVEVGAGGELVAWTWIEQPRPHHLLQEPFAFALIRLDGADTPFLHMLRAPKAALRPGLRVKVEWADQPRGAITDIHCFVPEVSA